MWKAFLFKRFPPPGNKPIFCLFFKMSAISSDFPYYKTDILLVKNLGKYQI